MNASANLKRVSFEEYERLPEDSRSELYQGELIVKTPGTIGHHEIRDDIGFALRSFVKEKSWVESILKPRSGFSKT